MRTATLLSILGLLGVCGCSSSSGDSEAAAQLTTPSAASGSRLRAKVITGGGARELVGFFDTARNEDCTFQRVADGRLFCLPSAVPVGISGAFADAACSKPLAIVTACGAGSKYVSLSGQSQNGCTSGITSLRPIIGAAPVIYASTGSGCVAQPPGPTPVSGVELGDDIPLDQFAAAEETTVKIGDLSEKVAAGVDGARQHLGYHADALDVDCTFQVMADGATRCVPTAASSAQLVYRDASCTEGALAYVYGNPVCERPGGSLLRDSAPTGCAAARAIYSVASDSGGSSEALYSASGSSCRPTSAPSSSTRAITNVTASLPKSDRVGRGTGRLAPALVSTGSGTLARGWRDTEKSVDCSFVKASDGKTRCLPTGSPGVVFFTDGTCTSPSRVATFAGSISCADVASSFVRIEEASCGAASPSEGSAVTTRVYALTGERRNVNGASWKGASGSCAQVAGVNDAADASEVDPAGFVEGTIVTE